MDLLSELPMSHTQEAKAVLRCPHHVTSFLPTSFSVYALGKLWGGGWVLGYLVHGGGWPNREMMCVDHPKSPSGEELERVRAPFCDSCPGNDKADPWGDGGAERWAVKQVTTLWFHV